MIGLSSSGGSSGDAGTDGLLNLLAVVSDPAATKARIQEIAAKNAEAAETLQKVVVINKDNENKLKEISDAQAATSLMQEALAAKDNDLKAREAKLSNDLAAHAARTAGLAADKKAFDEASSTKYAELEKRASDLAQTEKDNKVNLDKAVGEIAKTLADQKTALEAEYKDRLASAEALKADAAKDRDAAAASLAKAEEQRVFYEGRVSALQRAMQGTA